ncbi:efflux RND transporter periplasmic adaptor subunit [Calditerrivibrio nitroreducens]|uniref:Efflux transporter, RND family, MFP subunit n=1 Tax=Calditerrivibrio nitroreducens (strain DSM 19672 / NBRC 101217 / Yu37-1) TaxID=768670 RepID=E4TFU9_CALNY|nr:efflux RND transporter periplasmic adaptor subunit [Calditerrivibrio nitroreducens]ADR19605.1 efflux transporter, RND family, MFP subunit [Calditerrivibrio nitroreducens DSM 19672]
MFRYITFLMLLFVISCGGSNKDDIAKKEQVSSHKVSMAVVSNVQVPVLREFSGTVSSEEMVSLSPKVMGYITRINYTEGSSFKKGAVLVEISSPEIHEKLKFADAAVAEADNAISQGEVGLKVAQDQLRQAQAQYELAEKTYKRYKSLLASESISKQEFDQVEAQYKVALEGKNAAERAVRLAEERINQAKTKKNQAIAGKNEASAYVGYTRIVAPFDGVVLEKLIDVGNLAAPGQPIIKIGSNKNVIYTYVSESMFQKVKVGDQLDVKIDSMGKEFKSKVLEIAPNIDPATRNFKVKLSADKSVPVGVYVNVYVNDGMRDAIYVPKTAVVKRGQVEAVLVNLNGKADMRIVKTGIEKDGKVEILSGLSGGEKIVVNKLDNIKAGDILEG